MAERGVARHLDGEEVRKTHWGWTGWHEQIVPGIIESPTPPLRHSLWAQFRDYCPITGYGDVNVSGAKSGEVTVGGPAPRTKAIG
jgi:hypothetical protein